MQAPPAEHLPVPRETQGQPVPTLQRTLDGQGSWPKPFHWGHTAAGRWQGPCTPGPSSAGSQHQVRFEESLGPGDSTRII